MYKMLARLLSRPSVANWIIKKFAREENTYYHLVNPADPEDRYMGRWWVLKRRPWMNFCIRLHHINRKDLDENMHSHPFHYRTFILKGMYVEERPDPAIEEFFDEDDNFSAYSKAMRERFMRCAGDTVENHHGSFHRIEWVPPEGVWTLFVMWGGEKGDWGFMTPTGYIQKDEYFANHSEQR